MTAFKETGRVRRVLFAAAVLLAVGPGIHVPVFASEYKVAYFDVGEARFAKWFVTQAYRRLGVDATFEVLPAQRSLLLADTGGYDAELIRVPVIEAMYPNLIRVPTPIMETSFLVIGSADAQLPVESWADMADKQFAYPLGIKVIHAQAEKIGSGYPVSSIGNMWGMLEAGRVDYLVLPAREVEADEVQSAGFRIQTAPLEVIQLFHYLNKKHAALVPELDAQFKELLAMEDLLECHERNGTPGHTACEALTE